MGIEPTTSAWKAGVLPLNYTREKYFSTTKYILTDISTYVKLKLHELLS